MAVARANLLHTSLRRATLHSSSGISSLVPHLNTVGTGASRRATIFTGLFNSLWIDRRSTFFSYRHHLSDLVGISTSPPILGSQGHSTWLTGRSLRMWREETSPVPLLTAFDRLMGETGSGKTTVWVSTRPQSPRFLMPYQPVPKPCKQQRCLPCRERPSFLYFRNPSFAAIPCRWSSSDLDRHPWVQ